MKTEVKQSNDVKKESGSSKKNKVSFIASVKLTVISLSLIATTVLIGAWCPQESQVGREKVFETFGDKFAPLLIQYGIADIFHTPWFLFLIATLTLNLVACSFQRVFPKIRLLKQPMPFIKGDAIGRFPYTRRVEIADSRSIDGVVDKVEALLKKSRYTVSKSENKLVAHSGKVGRLAATVTHIGLLILVGGVTITSWTGFNGFQPVKLGDSMSFESSQHSKLWIGSLPNWQVRVDKTWKESYEGGQPKQWYSVLSVIDEKGKVVKSQTISVNNPLTYDGVDIYQASWGLDSLELLFNGQKRELPLQQMGQRHAAFLPLDKDSILIFSVTDKEKDSPLRLFAKRTEWKTPKKLHEIAPGSSVNLGGVELTFSRLLPRTGLQYKKDPGIFVVFGSFVFIIAGVMLAAIPYRQVWVSVESKEKSQDPEESNLKIDRPTVLYIGGTTLKGKVGFNRQLDALVESEFTDTNGSVAKAKPLDELASLDKDESLTSLGKGDGNK